ncbi:MAG: VanW family protein [Clostridia bacterium]|nr:VanW family protein [Clostridia bacterium]
MTSTQARRRKNRKQYAMRGLMDVIKMTAVMAVIVFAAIFAIRANNAVPSQDTFCEGVYVNGVSLGGMTYDEGYNLLVSQVEKRLNEDSFILYYGDKQWTFTPSEFNAQLDLTEQISLAWNFGHTGSARERREQAAQVLENPIHYDSEIQYDVVMLEDFIRAIKSEIEIEPVNAEMIVDTDEIMTIIPSQNGLTLSTGTLRNILDRCIMNGEPRIIELQPQVWEPDITTEILQANSVLIATCRTSTETSRTARTKNIRRALSFFNGFVVNPGETVSFNQVVGKRTLANGFYKSPEYDGTTVITGIGGGTCQAASTLYGALLRANIDVDVRYNHSMTVSYCRPSLDATVSDSKDLRFTNRLDFPIYIYTSVDSSRAEVKIYGPPCEYEISLESEITEIVEPKGRKFEKDTTGEYVYYTTDEPVLKEEGKQGMKSRGYRVYTDKETGEVVERQDLGLDRYYAMQPTYWIGVHDPSEEMVY